MRRIGLLVLVAVAALVAGGCAGADARRAEELLQQSDQALRSLKSYRYAGRFWIESEIGDFTLVMRGGGNTRGGGGGGASFLTMRSDDLPGFSELTVVQQGRSLWIRDGGGWKRAEAPSGQATALERFDVGAYVKDVSVHEGAIVNGEPATKVSGVLDTQELFDGFLASLGTASDFGDLPFDEASKALGDTHVVIYLSEATHLPIRTLVDLSLEAGGQKLELHLDFALEPAKRHVPIPLPAA